VAQDRDTMAGLCQGLVMNLWGHDLSSVGK